MNIKLLCIGKTADKKYESLIADYLNRTNYYLNFTIEYINQKIKCNSKVELQELEGNLILSKIQLGTILILLDEKGDLLTSVAFSKFFQKRLNTGSKEIVFVIGGAYGFSEAVYKRANFKVALSKMTFTHQMVRLIFVEQLYRALTILKGEKYHH